MWDKVIIIYFFYKYLYLSIVKKINVILYIKIYRLKYRLIKIYSQFVYKFKTFSFCHNLFNYISLCLNSYQIV